MFFPCFRLHWPMFMKPYILTKRLIVRDGNTITQVDRTWSLSLLYPVSQRPSPCEVYQKILTFFLYRQGLEAPPGTFGEVKTENTSGQKGGLQRDLLEQISLITFFWGGGNGWQISHLLWVNHTQLCSDGHYQAAKKRYQAEGNISSFLFPHP